MAPTEDRDIRLGDVVVRYPEDGHGGVFQYDFGQNIQAQNFHHTAVLDQPPEIVRSALSKIRSDYQYNGHSLHRSIVEILERNKRLRQRHCQPDRSFDILFMSDFVHLGDNNDKRRKLPCGDACSVNSARTESKNYPKNYNEGRIGDTLKNRIRRICRGSVEVSQITESDNLANGSDTTAEN